VTLAMLALWGALAHADAQAEFDAGVVAERGGDYAAAEQHFRAALGQGGRDPAVYHGLGEALYREGHVGLAIAAWRRGVELAPHDGDLAANLEHANKGTVDRLDPPTQDLGPFFWQRSLSPGQSARLASGLWTLAFALLFLRRATLGRQGRLAGLAARSRVAIPPLMALGLLLTLSTAAALRDAPGAVVIVPQVSARSTLGPDGLDLFQLHEGALVRVTESTPMAAQVQLPDGRKGWIAWTALASTDPAAPFPAGVL